MFYKNTRNFQELLLRQKFRQHFLDSSWSKIYGQHAKSRLQKPYMWTGIQVPVWNKHQHQHSNMLLLKKWPLRLRDGCLILRWNCSTQKTGGCFVEEGRDAKREIMVMTSTASFTEVTTFSFRGCCRFPLLASHWAKMHFIFPHIFFSLKSLATGQILLKNLLHKFHFILSICFRIHLYMSNNNSWTTKYCFFTGITGILRNLYTWK